VLTDAPSGTLFASETGFSIPDPQNPGLNLNVAMSAAGPLQISNAGTLNVASANGQPILTGLSASATCGVTGNASASLTIAAGGSTLTLTCPKIVGGVLSTINGQISFAPTTSVTETITLSFAAPTFQDAVNFASYSVQTSIPSATPIPFVTAVENAATGQIKDSTHGASANSFIAIYGGNMGSATSGGNIFPASSSNQMQVLINGSPVPLYNVNVLPSFSLINVALPSELPDAGAATLNVVGPAGQSLDVPLTLAPADAGIFRFTADSLHPNSGAITIANSGWRVMAASTAHVYGYPACAGLSSSSVCGQPARPGDNIVIYFTGGGLATPGGDPSGKPVPTGSVAPADGSVVYETVTIPQVTVGGIAAPVAFSGIAPGTAAEYQINTTISADVSMGNDVPLTIAFGNSSDTVTLAIQICAPYPSGFVPFTSIYSVAGPDANGDKVIVGTVLPGNLNQINQLLSPTIPDQEFCGTATLGDGYDVTAYVPTAAERAGNFEAFGAPIIDPLSNVPFPGNIIPESLLGQVYAWRIPSK
jgi:uncharacterized protein (TIGR03437 family)